MKKENIIKESRDFTKIINLKQNIKSKYYSIYYQETNLKINRYGITVPKKTAKAVVRNKLKRQIKNIIDQNKLTIQKPYDYVIIIKKEILNLTYQEKEKELLGLLKKIGEKYEKTN